MHHTSLEGYYNPSLKQPTRGQNGSSSLIGGYIYNIQIILGYFLAETRKISANVVKGLWRGARRKTLMLWRTSFCEFHTAASEKSKTYQQFRGQGGHLSLLISPPSPPTKKNTTRGGGGKNIHTHQLCRECWEFSFFLWCPPNPPLT